jgi:DNA-binding transcriptional ArsR family regulator
MPDELRKFKANIFQALAHPARVAIAEALREGELSAGQLTERLGLEQANGSQHLAVLRSRQVVVSRREGNQVFYSLRDPALVEVLDILRGYFLRQLEGASAMRQEIEAEGGVRRAGGGRA